MNQIKGKFSLPFAKILHMLIPFYTPTLFIAKHRIIEIEFDLNLIFSYLRMVPLEQNSALKTTLRIIHFMINVSMDKKKSIKLQFH